MNKLPCFRKSWEVREFFSTFWTEKQKEWKRCWHRRLSSCHSLSVEVPYHGFALFPPPFLARTAALQYLSGIWPSLTTRLKTGSLRLFMHTHTKNNLGSSFRCQTLRCTSAILRHLFCALSCMKSEASLKASFDSLFLSLATHSLSKHCRVKVKEQAMQLVCRRSPL